MTWPRDAKLVWALLAMVAVGCSEAPHPGSTPKDAGHEILTEDGGLVMDAAPPMEDGHVSAAVDGLGWPPETTTRPDDVGPPKPARPSSLDLAAHWAPVWYQDTDAQDPKADFIVAVDFDHDWVSSNNWDHLHEPDSDLGAVIYYAVMETDTHAFIFYLDFHPRDWSKACDLPLIGGCHENDMEGALVVIRKDTTTMGSFEVLVTQAHNALHIFRNDPAISAGTSPYLESVAVTFEDGSHPELYVESKGHGVCALHYSNLIHCQHPTEGNPPPFGGDDGVVYRYAGVSHTPKGGNDADVGYALVSLRDTLWTRRGDTCGAGCTFDGTFDWEGHPLPIAFDGDDYGQDMANPPWAWDDPLDGPVKRGDFFLRPAHALETLLNVKPPFSTRYTDNGFLDDLSVP